MTTPNSAQMQTGEKIFLALMILLVGLNLYYVIDCFRAGRVFLVVSGLVTEALVLNSIYVLYVTVRQRSYLRRAPPADREERKP